MPRFTTFILLVIVLTGVTCVLACNLTAALLSGTDVALVDESGNKITDSISMKVICIRVGPGHIK